MEKDFFKVDLHIHTIASRDYKGEKTDSEYLKILQRAKERKLKAIAITDHNSIAGYEKLMELNENLKKKRDEYLNMKDTKQVRAELNNINKDLKCFSDILILPGIEFETMDNVHILVIFNPETTTMDIKDFLKLGGYDRSNIGFKDAPYPPKWNILQLFEHAAKYDSIIIDAHTDRDKGIYNTLQRSPSYRARCFKSEHLNAVCYKNEKQKDELQNILKTPEYKRNTPLSFMRSSDAHKVDEVGKFFTWLKLKKITFDEIKEAVLNPDECVSVEEPEINKILNSLIEDDNSFGIETLSANDKEYFKKLVCALNNTESGYCLFGLNERKNRIGLPFASNRRIQDDLLKKYRKEIFGCLKKIDGECLIKYHPYPMQNNKLVISVRVDNTDNFVSLKGDDRIYIIKKGKLATLPAREFQRLIEEKNTKLIEGKIESTIKKIHKECELAINTIRSFPILKVFENNSIPLNWLVQISIKRSLSLDEIDEKKLKTLFDKSQHGKSKGTIVYIDEVTPPRLGYTYLRYSIPKFNLKLQDRLKKKENLYIIPGGAVYFSNNEYPIYSNVLPIALSVSSRYPKKYSNKFLACFLKSSFWLWYSKSKHEDFDLFKLNIFKNARIPKINLNIPKVRDIVSSIENNLDDILNKEKTFVLGKYKKDKLPDVIMAHNRAVDMLAYEIDQKIYELLELPLEQINIIEGFLKANNIYLPEMSKQSESSTSCVSN